MDDVNKSLQSESSSSAITEPQVLMYGCTPVPWQEEPYKFDPNRMPGGATWTSTNVTIMKIEEYKKKFIELFRQMEEEHGNCSCVTIGHSEDYHMENGTNISNLECTIEF